MEHCRTRLASRAASGTLWPAIAISSESSGSSGNPGARETLKRKSKRSTGSLYHEAGQALQIADRMGSLLKPLVRDAVARVASWIRAKAPHESATSALEAPLRELLMDQRVEDTDKVALVGLPWRARHSEVYLNALPRHLHEPVRTTLRIDEQWLDLKPGAQVMMIWNDDGKLWTNGDLGIVEEPSEDWVRVTTWRGTRPSMQWATIAPGAATPRRTGQVMALRSVDVSRNLV